ncbi:MAG: hypothetical protein PUB00_00660 [Clostridiales bacterium]|nr:hypothetical protein [Clostridiales bacterium]
MMRTQAIVYTSNTGSTAHYAKLLSQETGLPVYSADEAKKQLPNHSEIIYLGWIMASSVKGYRNAAKRYQIRAVCAVGMCQTGKQIKEVRENNAIPDSVPLFTLQGNFDIKKLHGIYGILMNIMVKTSGKALTEKSDRTPEENDMLDMMLNGSERVCLENLKAVLDWYNKSE